MNNMTNYKPHIKLDSQTISLIRSTPPTPQWLGSKLANTLKTISEKNSIDVLLRYHKFTGSEFDKELGGKWLAERLGYIPEPDRIIITNGTQNAMLLSLSNIVGRGGILIVEELSYHGLRQLAHILGVRVEVVAMDHDGALPDAFEQICRRTNPKAIFLQPTLHNPTTIIMSEERRREIISIARRYGVAIIEDDVYGALPLNAPPPLATLGPDVTWYATGPAKCIAPGLRIGYLVAPTVNEAERAFGLFKIITTWHTSPLSAAIMVAWIQDGTVMRLRDSIRLESAERQIIASRLLLGKSMQTKPESLFLWIELPHHWAQKKFIEAAAQIGIVLRNGNMFYASKIADARFLRIVLGSPEDREQLSHALSKINTLLEAK